MASVKLIVIILFVLGVKNISSSSQETNSGYLASMLAKAIGYRLPNNTIPKLYKIHLEPHIDNVNFTFDGTNTVNFEVISPTKDVIVHASEFIEIDKTYTKLILDDGTIRKPIEQKWNSFLEFFFIQFDSVLNIGNYTIEFKWLGHDADILNGFFRGENSNHFHNSSTFMVTTHFQTNGARGAFPCWDEPGYRAEFDISVKHFPNYTAISNMPVKNHIDAENGKIWTIFERTPSMSTYLVTFVLADYDKYINKDGNITFWAPKDELTEVEYAFNISQLVVPALEKYTDIEFDLPKLDQVSMPRYPSSGTEHWGMISYGDFAVYYNPERGNIDRKDRVALLVAHEISHQWFGDLVTPAWWDDLWLSEAFAVYFSYKMLDDALDNQHFLDTFVVSTVNEISFDAERDLRRPRPIVFKTDSPSETRELFSPVTYRKGAAVVQMLEHIVSSEVFQLGIQKYLKKHQMSTVKTDDLWQSLQEVYDEKMTHSNLYIKEIMDPWIKQTGYPMLNVTRNYENGLTNITQMNALNSKSHNSWSIPLNFATSSHVDFNSTLPTHWVPRENKTLSISEIDKNDWVILNIQQTGFYRVNYDYENWKRIAEYLNTEDYHKINVRNRAQLIWDLQYLYSKEDHYLESLVDVLSYLHREVDFLPWIPAIAVLQRLSLMNTPAEGVFLKFALYLMDNIINHIGYESSVNDDRMVTMARENLVLWVCRFGHEGCQTAANAIVVAKVENKTSNLVSPSMSSLFLCNGLKNLNNSAWEMLIDAYFEEHQLEFGTLSIGCSNNLPVIKKYLDMSIRNAVGLNRWDEFLNGILSILAGQQRNVDFALEYLIENIDRIRRYYESSDMSGKIYQILEKFSRSIKTNDQFEKFSTFLTQQGESGKINRTRRMIDATREHMMASEKVSTSFLAVMNKKPYLANFINT